MSQLGGDFQAELVVVEVGLIDHVSAGALSRRCTSDSGHLQTAYIVAGNFTKVDQVEYER